MLVSRQDQLFNMHIGWSYEYREKMGRKWRIYDSFSGLNYLPVIESNFIYFSRSDEKLT